MTEISKVGHLPSPPNGLGGVHVARATSGHHGTKVNLFPISGKAITEASSPEKPHTHLTSSNRLFISPMRRWFSCSNCEETNT